jgi:hypothetical protein
VKANGDTFFQAWLAADMRVGPQQAYRLACRLAEAMRPLGRSAAIRADWALAHTLLWRGRFIDAQALLAEIAPERVDPTTDAGFSHVDLKLLLTAQKCWNSALLDDYPTAQHHSATLIALVHDDSAPLHRAYASHALSLLYCLFDQASECLNWSLAAQSDASNCGDSGLLSLARVLEYWASSRLHLAQDEQRVQTALATLRRLGLAQEARGFSLYTQALFHQSPSHAVTQIDAALDLNARCGLHLWDARLQHMKARSLDAAGLLGEADRFLHRARETARQQGARLFLNDMTGIESRTPAFSTREIST